jgi:glutathione S-transferase
VFQVWEQDLLRSGGPYLVGELSLADLCFVPTVIRLVTHAPSLERWPLATAWTKLLLERAAVKEWLNEARSLPPVIPDGDGN